MLFLFPCAVIKIELKDKTEFGKNVSDLRVTFGKTNDYRLMFKCLLYFKQDEKIELETLFIKFSKGFIVAVQVFHPVSILKFYRNISQTEQSMEIVFNFPESKSQTFKKEGYGFFLQFVDGLPRPYPATSCTVRSGRAIFGDPGPRTPSLSVH